MITVEDADGKFRLDYGVRNVYKGWMKNSGGIHHAHENTTLDTISNVGMPPLETPPEGERKPKTFTDEEVMDELKDILYGARDKVHFRFKHGTDLVEVYIGKSLNYIINRNLYNKIIGDE